MEGGCETGERAAMEILDAREKESFEDRRLRRAG